MREQAKKLSIHNYIRGSRWARGSFFICYLLDRRRYWCIPFFQSSLNKFKSIMDQMCCLGATCLAQCIVWMFEEVLKQTIIWGSSVHINKKKQTEFGVLGYQYPSNRPMYIHYFPSVIILCVKVMTLWDLTCDLRSDYKQWITIWVNPLIRYDFWFMMLGMKNGFEEAVTLFIFLAKRISYVFRNYMGQ